MSLSSPNNQNKLHQLLDQIETLKMDQISREVDSFKQTYQARSITLQQQPNVPIQIKKMSSDKSLKNTGFITHIDFDLDNTNTYLPSVGNSVIFRQYFSGDFIITISNNFIQTNAIKDYKLLDKVKI